VQLDIGQRRRVYVTASAEEVLGVRDCSRERVREISKRRQDQVTQGVTGQPLTVREAVLKDAGGQPVLIGSHGDQAVSDVAGREHSELTSQLAGRTTVIGHGDDGARIEAELEKAVDDRRKTCAAANGDRAATRADAHRSSRSRPISRWPTTAR
jgi:hypothetical protein